jgi:hypothetical protein
VTLVEVVPLTDAGRMAFCSALRRDWAPPPATTPWTPAMQEALFSVALEIEAEAQARLNLHLERLPL